MLGSGCSPGLLFPYPGNRNEQAAPNIESASILGMRRAEAPDDFQSSRGFVGRPFEAPPRELHARESRVRVTEAGQRARVESVLPRDVRPDRERPAQVALAPRHSLALDGLRTDGIQGVGHVELSLRARRVTPREILGDLQGLREQGGSLCLRRGSHRES